MSKTTNSPIKFPLACALVLMVAGIGGAAAGPEGDEFDRKAAEATILELAYWPTRFDTWIDRCKLRPFGPFESDKKKEKIEPEFLSEFGLKGDKAAKAEAILKKFMEESDALGNELMFRGDPDKVDIPGRANRNPVHYLEVPRTDGPQILLKRKHALDLARVVGDPAMALAMLQLVSRDYNHHGRLAIAHPITEWENDDGKRGFTVRRIFLSSAGRNPIGEGDSAGSAASIAQLPAPYGRFFTQKKLARADREDRWAAFGGPVSDSIKHLEHPSMETLRETEPVDQLGKPELGPLITKNPDLAKIIMRNTDLIIFTGETELLTLFHIGVPEKPAREIAKILTETVGDLTSRLSKKNEGVEVVINGPVTKVQGLTQAEHDEVVAELEATLAKQYPDFPKDLTSYVTAAFAQSTSDYTLSWEIKVREDRKSGFMFFPGGYPRHTEAVSTDLKGNETKVRSLPYPLRFLKFVAPK